jgi:hypothetical protein
MELLGVIVRFILCGLQALDEPQAHGRGALDSLDDGFGIALWGEKTSD